MGKLVLFFHNSLIIHVFIYQIVYAYNDLYLFYHLMSAVFGIFSGDAQHQTLDWTDIYWTKKRARKNTIFNTHKIYNFQTSLMEVGYQMVQASKVSWQLPYK